MCNCIVHYLVAWVSPPAMSRKAQLTIQSHCAYKLIKNSYLSMKLSRFFSTAVLTALLLSATAATYTNPILPYDYSDPDVCRVGKIYYMTSSSFNCVPGLQILESADLVHWQLVDAALPTAVPGTEQNEAPQYGGGVWAPSIRHHDGRFYIYYGDPDRGVYCVRSEKTTTLPCRWEKAVLVCEAKGYIDACPLWDDNGRVYLVHAFAGSRAGFKSALAVMELSADGLSAVSASRLVFDGHPDNPTTEGPKFYKRSGYYYIFCPAGGVATGWQLVLRSRSPYGPYEAKRVLEQGTTAINAPHQGAWVTSEPLSTDLGTISDWFFHFQDVGVAGRIVHLQPMRWVGDWPVMGKQGEPVSSLSVSGLSGTTVSPQAGVTPTWRDDFSAATLDLSWQWSGNYRPQYAFCNSAESLLRLFSYPTDSIHSASNLLLQKIPAGRAFTITTKVRFTPNPKTQQYERAGLMVAGRQSFLLDAPKNGKWVWLRVEVTEQLQGRFYLSNDGKTYTAMGAPFTLVEGEWIGAKVGLFCCRSRVRINDSGYIDVDFFELR